MVERMLQAKELLNKSRDELEELSNQLAKDIYELVNEFSLTRKVEKPHLIREKKRERARVLTVLNQKI